MNLALEKGERVTTRGKGRGEIGGEAGKVTGVLANVPTLDGLGKRYGMFSFLSLILFPFPQVAFLSSLILSWYLYDEVPMNKLIFLPVYLQERNSQLDVSESCS